MTVVVPKSVHVNRQQKHLIDAYNDIDAGNELLGYHHGRPVVWTFTTRRDHGYPHARRHVVIIQRNGLPGDLPEHTWQERFTFLDRASAGLSAQTRRQRVRNIVNDWLSWSTRS